MALHSLVLTERTNAVIGWIALGIVALAGIASLREPSILWGGFSLLVIVIIALPVVATRDWRTMVPWPVVMGAAMALIARAAGRFPEAAGYVAIATLALAIVVELDVFTPIEFSRRFAIAFAVMMTLALEALWIIAQFVADGWLGTDFLGSQTDLQRDIVAVSLVGFAMGGAFYLYVATIDHGETADRQPEHGGTP